MNSTKVKLGLKDWRALQQAHLNEVSPFTSRFRNWRGKGGKHPVYDFLFTYYDLSTGKFEEWHPGYGVALEYEPKSHSDTLLRHPLYRLSEKHVSVSLNAFRPREIKQLNWVHSLSKTILEREERYSCFGLHEWAMLYRTDAVRHDYPLRLSSEEIATAFEEVPFCCSHHDAFRFASPAAKKLNVLQPFAETRLEDEQGGCIHVNMDLYKWAYKLLPLTSSDLVRRCFLLTLHAREIDMRASPYDLRSLGFEPIAIETEAGKREYQSAQRVIAERARSLRTELLGVTENLLQLLVLRNAGARVCDLTVAGFEKK